MKREIVGARIMYSNNDSIITNDRMKIINAIQSNYDFEFLDKQHMKIMDSADLGVNWENMAKSRTIFIIENDTLFYPTTITYNDTTHYIKYDPKKSFIESIKDHFIQLGEDTNFVESLITLIAEKIKEN